MKEKEFVIQNVRGDGSCFFRSLYGAAMNKRGAIKKIAHCLLDPDRVTEYKKNEDVFVRDVRERLSFKIKNREDGGIVKDIYRNLKGLSDENYEAVISAFPDWMQEAFPKRPRHETKFRNIIAIKIKDFGSWVSEMEVSIIQEILKSCKGNDINIVVLNSKPDKHTFKFKPKTLYVLNICEAHYNFIAQRRQTKIAKFST